MDEINSKFKIGDKVVVISNNYDVEFEGEVVGTADGYTKIKSKKLFSNRYSWHLNYYIKKIYGMDN